jgi:hypothetical protein
MNPAPDEGHAVHQVAEIRVSDDGRRDWLVWWDSKLVARFAQVTEALALAAMLECSPSTRAGARAIT